MDLEIIKADKTAARRPAARAAKVDLEIVLEQHRDWVKSNRQTGRQADLSRLNLEGADLTDTNLRNALLNETVLKGADLLLTDLQGASLLQANLQEANLLGARLRDANLQGATLEGATGLLAAELAGTNLTFAKMPAEVATAEDLKYISRRGWHAAWLISTLLLLDALACWRIITVSDAQILRNASLLPFPVLRNGVPLVQFFLLSPLLIGALYLWLHVYLQRFWEATAALPAIFENGQRLDQSLPWLVSWPARHYFQWLRERRSALAGVEKAICVVLLYWATPATMMLFWARYLTLQDLRGTILHAALIAAATAAAIHFPRSTARAFRSDDSESFSRSTAAPAAASADAMLAEALATPLLPGSLTAGPDPQPRSDTRGDAQGDSEKKSGSRHITRRIRIPISAAFGLILCLLSIGAIGGAPHGGNPAQGIGSGSPRTWAADALWLVGYIPYAQVNEAEISRKPAGWTGSEGEISHVQGAILNGFQLRYAQAYSAFLVKARLRQADLSYAYLSDADLRQANLRQASLRSAMLDQAKLNGATMQSADLQKANLIRAELGKADLSFALLGGALLQDAKLDGAVLYGADLRNASLERASFEQADLRQAELEGANLKMSNLREAYLSTAKMAGARLEGSQLGSAILMGADLRGADLSNTNIQGAVLSGADFSGANLQNADLRGVVGLTAAQICAAASARQAQLDDTLAAEVSARCGGNR